MENHVSGFISYNKTNNAPYGTWKCSVCYEIFRTKNKLSEHTKNIHPLEHICKYCGLNFETFTSLAGHVKGCIKNPNYEKHRKTFQISNKKSMKDDQKETLSSIMKKRLPKGKQSINYSNKACEYINKLNEEKGWNLQHAENGGEKRCGKFSIDGYDSVLNIAFEYDEIRHYENVIENKLCEKDILRMKIIHEKLKCRFFRYNEKLNLLYEVNFE